MAAAAISSPSKPNWRLLSVAAVCAMLPDADVLAFRFRIPYSHMFGHRGFSHSFFFAALVALVATYLLRRSDSAIPMAKTWAILFVAMASHGILDSMTSGGGLGIAFFAPFSNERYFLPWRPIRVSPIGIRRFFSPPGVAVLSSELVWVWIPSGVVLAVVAIFNGRQVFTRRDGQ